MIEVELPDGSIAEFPDGTGDDVIQSVLQRQFGSPQQQQQAVTPQAQPEPTWTDTAKDVGASLLSGVGRGAAGLFGLPGTIQNAFDNSFSAITGIPAPRPSPLSSEGLQSGLSTITGGASDYQPQTTAGEYAGTVGEFLPGAALGGAGVGNLVRFGVVPGLASEGAGQLTEGSSTEPYARVAAALAAPAVPAIASRAISPFSGQISPERQALVEALRSEGVNPTAGQILGNKRILASESELGGRTAAGIVDDNSRAFTEAAMSRAGQSGIATPDNIAAMQNRIGKGFNDISARNVVVSDAQLGNDIGNVLNKYDRVLPTAQKDIVNNMADDIVNVINSNQGTIPGKIYQESRSRFSRMAQAARNSDPEYADALRGLRNALDDAMARSVKPEDAAEWARLRNEYGNSKILSKAAAGAGENAAEGFISPARLRQAASAGRQGQYSASNEGLDKLARAGQILSPFPDSGTATRLNARSVGGLLAGGGALAGGVPGFVAGMLAPPVAGAALMSRPVQAYLTNQLAPNMSTIDPRTLNVIQALIANQGQ